jgi:hypothetical protein
VGGQHHAPAAFHPGKTRSPPPGFDPRTDQPLASRYTDWTTRYDKWIALNLATTNIIMDKNWKLRATFRTALSQSRSDENPSSASESSSQTFRLMALRMRVKTRMARVTWHHGKVKVVPTVMNKQHNNNNNNNNNKFTTLVTRFDSELRRICQGHLNKKAKLWTGPIICKDNTCRYLTKMSRSFARVTEAESSVSLCGATQGQGDTSDRVARWWPCLEKPLLVWCLHQTHCKVLQIIQRLLWNTDS